MLTLPDVFFFLRMYMIGQTLNLQIYNWVTQFKNKTLYLWLVQGRKSFFFEMWRKQEVVDILGKVHLKQKLKKADYSFSINIKGLPEGIYFVNLFSNDQLIASEKLLKMK